MSVIIVYLKYNHVASLIVFGCILDHMINSYWFYAQTNERTVT